MGWHRLHVTAPDSFRRDPSRKQVSAKEEQESWERTFHRKWEAPGREGEPDPERMIAVMAWVGGSDKDA